MSRPSYALLKAEVCRLRGERAQLAAENAALKKRAARAEKRTAELEGHVASLEARIASQKVRIAELEQALQAALRKSKRQAAPFSHGEPKANPGKPGRKKGRRYGPKAHRAPPAPEQIDEHYQVPLPASCPHCGEHDLQESDVVSQFQTEIPRRPIVRQFDIHCGICRKCGRAVHGRHELQTSDAVGAAAAQLGPGVHAAMALLNKELGLPHGKVKRCLEVLFGISIARATSAHSVRRTARKCALAYEGIRTSVRKSKQVVPDETGWRVGGGSAWLHAIVGKNATYYEISPRRGSQVPLGLLGPKWRGAMTHDGWRGYDVFTHARHQQCLQHLQRRCHRLLETARGGAVRFPRKILEMIQTAFALRDAYREHKVDEDELALQGLALSCELQTRTEGRFSNDANRKLAKHLARHIRQWFWFLIEPQLDATNWRAEHAIRPAVVNRKVWGGNRQWSGASDHSVLTSVQRTCTQRRIDPFEFLVRTLCSPIPPPLSQGGKQ